MVTVSYTHLDVYKRQFGSQTAQNITGNIIGIFATAFGLVSELVASFARDLINFIVQPIVDNKQKIITAINELLAPIETITQGIETFLHNVADGVTDLCDNHIAPVSYTHLDVYKRQSGVRGYGLTGNSQ